MLNLFLYVPAYYAKVAGLYYGIANTDSGFQGIVKLLLIIFDDVLAGPIDHSQPSIHIYLCCSFHVFLHLQSF